MILDSVEGYMILKMEDGRWKMNYVRWKECTKRPGEVDDSKEWTASIPGRVNSEDI